jgi:hypothetical protein
MLIPPSLLLAALISQLPDQARFPGREVAVVDDCGEPVPNAIVRLKPVAPSDGEEQTLDGIPDFPGFYFTDRIPANTTSVRISITIRPRPGSSDVPNNPLSPEPVPYRRRLIRKLPRLESSLTIRGQYCPDPYWLAPSQVLPPTFNPYLGPPNCQALPSGERVVVVPTNSPSPDTTWVTVPQRRQADVASAFRYGSLTPERIRIPFADDAPGLPVPSMPVVSADPQR